MFDINARRLILFVTLILGVALMLQQYWQRKSDSEKWLYFNERVARSYAGEVLGPGRGTRVPLPEGLTGTTVTTYDSYVTFAPMQSPDLVLAFSPDARPPKPPSPGGGSDWVALGDGWYELSPLSATGRK